MDRVWRLSGRPRDVEVRRQARQASALDVLYLGGDGPLAKVIREHMDDASRRALAATSTVFMARVLEFVPNAKWWHDLRGWGPTVARRVRARVTPASQGQIGHVREDGCRVFARGKATSARDSAVTSAAIRAGPDWIGLSPGMIALEHVDMSDFKCKLMTDGDDNWLPVGPRGGVKVLLAARSGLRRVPPDMASLSRLTLSRCKALDTSASSLLPSSSCASLVELDVSRTRVRRLPADMARLETLVVAGCTRLDHDFLAGSSAAAVKHLDAKGSNIACVPAHMHSLERVNLSGCQSLVDGLEYIPSTSAGNIRWLDCGHSNVQRVPDMPRLEELDCSSCPLRGGAFHATRFAKLKKLVATRSTLRMLPAAACQLEYLDVRKCSHLGTHFLPESSARSVRFLYASHSKVTRLPPGMGSLEILILDGCKSLDATEFLPESSAGAVRVLSAARGSVKRLPGGLRSLREAYLTACPLVDDFLPTNAAPQLTVLHACYTGIKRVPPNLPLEELSLFHCQHLAQAGEASTRPGDDAQPSAAGGAQFLPRSSLRKLRKLVLAESNVQRVPEDMVALERLHLHRCYDLRDGFCPPSSAARVRHLDISHTHVTQVPCMRALRELDVSDCVRLEEGRWLDAATAQGLRKLRADNCRFAALPPGLESLQELRIRGCEVGDIGPLQAKIVRSWF
ncbi:unnamed protein product [Pedinophyceae sp. YPF-701]|nr:unnamed protein product [Pedinophyceae sp. YPF-701]